MPQQQALPTWLALNNVNSPYQSGQGDAQTGFPYNAGGLNQGDYFDLTNDEAAGASYPPTAFCTAVAIGMCRLTQALPLRTSKLVLSATFAQDQRSRLWLF